MTDLLDKILSRSNMLDAYNQVKANKGSADIYGITIDQIDDYLRQLGIPTVMDRMIQLAIIKVISPLCELYFSETSYVFVPNGHAKKLTLSC